MRTLLQNILSWLCVFVLIIGLSELTLRIVPSEAQYPPLYDYDYKDSLLGIEFFPSTVRTERTACHTSVVTTNSFGWRDQEHAKERVPGLTRIAILGDSFMAGTQVNDDEVFARQLEKILGKDKVEVLNFGLSSIGTEQEDILYENVVSTFDPDIVLLAFYSNDVENSDPDMEGGPLHATRLTYRDDDGNLLSFRKRTPFDGTRHWLRMHSALYRFANVLYRFARQETASPSGISGFPPYPREYHVFDAPAPPERERGWARVDRAIQSLKRQISPPKQLIAFSVPELLETAPDIAALIRKQYGQDPPKAFTPSYPFARFAKIAEHHGVPFIDLVPVFLAEQSKRALVYPYFYFSCDGHWNALGHTIAAEAVARVVEKVIDSRTIHRSM